jgi:uncharacterized protein YbjT (DUF2867 family)
VAHSNGPVLVTSANGNPGSEITRRLVDSGFGVKAAVRSFQNSDRIKHLPVEVVVVDLLDKTTLDNAFSGIERIVTIVPLGPHMVKIASRIVEAAKRFQINHLVYLSLLNEDIKAKNIFSRNHALIEKMIIDSGLPYTIIRSTFFLQTILFLYREFIKRGVLAQPAGKAAVAVIDLRDISKLIALVLRNREDHLNKTYSVTNGESYDGNQAAEIFGEALGRKMIYFDRPKFLITKGMKEAGFSPWLIKATWELFADLRAGKFDVRENTFTKITGSEPIPYRQSIKDYSKYIS